MASQPRLIIAGVRGGAGKTTIALGIIAALRLHYGLAVTPFKKGPDYIDAGWLSVAAGRPCYNLDPFLISRDNVLWSFLSRSAGDIAVVEGNRGLYDGMDASGTYSTADLAKLLKAPALLVVDCTKMTRTAAAVVLGCQLLDREVPIRGVILNQVAGERHETVVRESIEQACGLPVLGAVPRLRSEEFPERHMGLTPFQEHPDTERAVSFAEGIARQYLDLNRILSIAREAGPLGTGTSGDGVLPCPPASGAAVRIGVIQDSAFQFYYPENIEELRRCGAEIVTVSAITARGLPLIDALYIGGGFPETHAIALAENASFRDSLRKAVHNGLPVYAECGGLMYLGEGLVLGGKTFPMAGVFPLRFSLEERPQAHGYSIVEVVRPNPFFPEGTVLRGHEFHYSRPMDTAGDAGEYLFTFRMQRGIGIRDRMDGICTRNVLATYTHLHALGAPAWVEGMLRQARAYRYGRYQAAREPALE